MATKKTAPKAEIKGVEADAVIIDEAVSVSVERLVETVPEKEAPAENELIALLPEFAEAFKVQLASDQERWGDEWKKRPTTGQEFRNFNRFKEYIADFVQRAVPMPWLKVIGNAYIAWVRENHPELLEQ